jgi:uncharacterized membrane protein YdjX (TVP38/TMEM64 family)
VKAIQKRLLIGLALIGIIILLRILGIHNYFTLEAIRKDSLLVQNFIQEFYGFSVLSLIGIFAATVMLAIPVTPFLTLASGFFFGTILGAVYAILGSTLGATLSFFTFRYLLRAAVEHRYGNSLQKFNAQFQKQGASYLLFMQLLPITPFLIIIIISSLSSVSWWTFVWTTMVGIAPGSFIYAFAGQQLMTLEKASDILSWPMIIALTLLACVALVPLVIKKIKPTAPLE